MPLVLWDLDGTLLRAGGVSRDAFEAAFVHVVGRVPALASDVRFAGRTDPWIAREVCRAESVDEALCGPLLARLPVELEARADRLAREAVVLPHVPEVLSALAARGWRQGVVTGNLRSTARTKLAGVGLDGRLDLDAAAYGDDGPTRDALVPVALARAGVRPQDAWVVGDTPHDLACARAGGVRCLLVATGSHPFDELAGLGADAVLPDLGGALDVLVP